MDLQTEKLNLLQTIINTDDEALLMDVKALIDNRQADWFDELDESQQRDVLDALEEADKGETVSHNEVVKLFGKWGLK